MTTDGVAAFLGRRVIFAKLAAGILWVCYVASIVLGSGGGTYNLKGEVLCADHMAFYTAARLIREGHDDKVYDYPFVAAYQKEMFAGHWESLEAFRNPPFYALLYYPTAGWRYAASAWTWAAVNLVITWFSVRWLVGGSPPVATGGLPPTKAYLWAFSFYPVFAGMSYGQNSLLSLFAFAGTYRLLAAGRPFAAGLVAGLLCFKPPLLLGLIVWGLIDIRRLWPAAVGVVVTGAVLVGGSYLIVPVVWDGFVGTLGGNVKFADFEQFKMHNPVAFWRLLLPDAAGWQHWLLAAGCSLVAVAAFVKLWRARRDDLAVMFGGVVFLTLWASPHALIYEWAILVAVGMLWWPETRRRPAAWFLLYFAAWVVFFISTHFAEWQLQAQEYLGTGTQYGLQLSVPVLGVVGWRAVSLLTAARLDRPADAADNQHSLPTPPDSQRAGTP